MTDEALMARLRQVADKDAIRDVLMRFCRGVDRLDEALLRSCDHVDSDDDHGPFKGNGQDFAADRITSISQRAHHPTHAVANVCIEIASDDPDVARSASYVLAYRRRTDDDGTAWLDCFSGRYVDRFPLPMDTFTQGRRDRGDLVYRL